MEDDLNFLDGDVPADAPAVAQPETPAEPAGGPARGPDGKFIGAQPSEPAPVAEAQPQTPETPPAAAQPAQPEAPLAVPPGYVPVGVVQELRNELNALKRQPQQPPQPAPDPYEDFEGYQAHLENQQQVERAEWSRRLALATNPPEAVQQAQEWAASQFERDPVFRERSLSSPDPYGFALAEWKRDQVLSKLTDPTLIDRFLAFASGAAPAQAPTAPQAPPAPQPVAVPTSITGQPSAGGIGAVPLGDAALFDSVIPKG